MVKGLIDTGIRYYSDGIVMNEEEGVELQKVRRQTDSDGEKCWKRGKEVGWGRNRRL